MGGREILTCPPGQVNPVSRPVSRQVSRQVLGPVRGPKSTRTIGRSRPLQTRNRIMEPDFVMEPVKATMAIGFRLWIDELREFTMTRRQDSSANDNARELDRCAQ